MATDAQILAEAVERRREHLAKQAEAGRRRLRPFLATRGQLKAVGATGLRAMQDAVTWQNISPSVPIVGGYDDGLYAWPAIAWQTCAARGQKAVHYVVNPAHNIGNCLDVEQGDATPGQAPGWVAMRRRSGLPQPGVYCSTSVWPQVQGAFNAAGMPWPDWDLAAYPGIGPVLYAGTVAHQYADPGPVDLSVVAPYWAAIDGGTPPPPPAPPPHAKDDLVFLATFGNNPATYVSNGHYFRFMTSMDAAKALGWVIAANGGNPNPFHFPDLEAMGLPLDKRTADAAGVPWPPDNCPTPSGYPA